MKRLGVQLLSVLLAGMFLVSFAGIRLLTHHCFSCDSTDVVMIGLTQSDDCDEIHHHHQDSATCGSDHKEGDYSCCGGTEKHQESQCGDDCESETHYLRAEYDASPDRSPAKIASPEFMLLSAFVCSTQELAEKPVYLSFTCLNDPPPRPAGRELVIRARRLKYC